MLTLYWSTFGNTISNFGDQLSPIIVEALHGDVVTFCDLPNADIIGLGSILHHGKESRGYIWGSGYKVKHRNLRGTPYENTKKALLRGKLTKQLLDCNDDIPMGDPGLLVKKLWPDPVPKIHKLGLIPHLHQRGNDLFRKISDNQQSVIIDVYDKPSDVIRQIKECQFIASASLHGLVTADSFGIPNCWIKTTGSPQDFKYHDYYSVWDYEQQPLELHGFLSTEKIISHIENVYIARDVDSIIKQITDSFPYPTNGTKRLLP